MIFSSFHLVNPWSASFIDVVTHHKAQKKKEQEKDHIHVILCIYLICQLPSCVLICRSCWSIIYHIKETAPLMRYCEGREKTSWVSFRLTQERKREHWWSCSKRTKSKGQTSLDECHYNYAFVVCDTCPISWCSYFLASQCFFFSIFKRLGSNVKKGVVKERETRPVEMHPPPLLT